jgi:phage terminase large subunit-like protein
MKTRSTSSKPKSYLKIATGYARRAIADTDQANHCKWLRLAAQRFLDDLERAGKPGTGFAFDEAEADRACRFIELLPHIEGEWSTPTITLEPFQVLFLVCLFGFRNPDGTRRFTTALLAVGRKNGKSAFASGIALYVFLCEGHNGPQVITAATTGDQAKIVFSVAKAMVEKTPALRKRFDVKAFARAILCNQNHGTMKYVSAKASTQDGLNPAAIVLDEIHAHKTPDLLNVLKSAAGARANQLWLYLTTEGYENPGPWAGMRKFAQQVLEGLVGAEHFLCFLFTLDKDDDEYDERVWVKANPLIESSPLLFAAIKRDAIEAQGIPSMASEFKIKRCNLPASVADGFVDIRVWRNNGVDLDLDMLEGYPCYAALDLASTRDTTAWRLVWDVDGTWYTWGRYWVPRECVFQRTQRGTAAYDQWISAGWMTQTEGNVTDYARVYDNIVADCERFRPRVIAYDDWNSGEIVAKLAEDELPLRNFIQGPRSYHPAVKQFERLYLRGKLKHSGDPVLTWHASNLIMRYDDNLNMAPDKKRSAEKIDGMVALLMAIGVSMSADDMVSVYEERGLLSI